MTDQFTPYVPPANYAPATLKPGQILYTHCAICDSSTPHKWGGWPPLACQDPGHAARLAERAEEKRKAKAGK